MLFKDYLNDSRSKIADHFRKIILDKKNNDDSKLFEQLNILTEIEDFALRGKLIRGTLFLMVCQMLGQKIDSKHLSIAVSIELIHSGLLIHDDIIDNDRTRRGEKSVWSKYEDRGRELSVVDSLHYGRSMAIVVADAAYFYAVEILASVDSKKTLELIKFISNEIYNVCLAEGLDSELGQRREKVDRSDILSVYKYKTARYTFSMPFVMGCIYAGGDKKDEEVLEEIGEKAGIIFQLKDDEIGFFGREEEIGKPVGSDIREDKKTIIRDLLFEKADEGDRKILSQHFGNPEISLDEISQVRDIAQKYEVLKDSNEMMNEKMQEIESLKSKISFSNHYVDILNQLLDYNISRTS